MCVTEIVLLAQNIQCNDNDLVYYRARVMFQKFSKLDRPIKGKSNMKTFKASQV